MKGLQDDNWIRALARMHTPSQLYEFVNLWTLLARTNLDPDRDDSISWKWTSSGVYSSASAYAAQFHGSHPEFLSSKIWSAHVEPKCKFFSCLVLHGRTVTADMLAIRGWLHHPICKLCLRAPETAVHLCKDCPFSQAAWSNVQAWTGEIIQATTVQGTAQGVSDWWETMIEAPPKEFQRHRSGRPLYTIWNIWKERTVALLIGSA